MSASFTKLFSSIITSTVWREDLETKVTWITLLALADQHGEVQGSVPGLAHLAGVSVEGCKAALERFLSPDEYSRTKDHEGRRIEEIPGGWAILNYLAYRRLASKEEAIEKARDRVRRHRERKSDVTLCNGMKRSVTQFDTEAEAEAEEDKNTNEAVSRVFACFAEAAERRKWPKPSKFTATRQRRALKLLNEHGEEGIRSAVARAEASTFINSGAAWWSFDWFLKPENFTKLVEGNYDNRHADPPRQAAGWN